MSRLGERRRLMVYQQQAQQKLLHFPCDSSFDFISMTDWLKTTHKATSFGKHATAASSLFRFTKRTEWKHKKRTFVWRKKPDYHIHIIQYTVCSSLIYFWNHSSMDGWTNDCSHVDVIQFMLINAVCGFYISFSQFVFAQKTEERCWTEKKNWISLCEFCYQHNTPVPIANCTTSSSTHIL